MDENDSFVVNPPRPHQTSLDSDEGQSNLSPLAIENASYHVSDAHERMVSGLVREINCDSAVPSIAYSPDGTQVFVGRYDKKAVAYDITTGAVLHEFIYECHVNVVAYSPNGSQIAVGLFKFDCGAIVYDAVTYEQLYAIERNSGISTISYSPDSNQIIIGGTDKKAIIYDTSSGTILREFNQDSHVKYVAFSPTGDQVSMGMGDKNMCVYNSVTGDLIHKICCEGKISTLTYSPDASRIAAGGSDRKVVIYDAVSATILLELKRGGYITSIAYSPNGSQIAVSARDSKVTIYDSTSGDVLHQFIPVGEVRSVVYSPDSTQLCVGGFNNNICWYKAATRTVLSKFSRDSRTIAISYSPDGKQIAVGGDDNAVIVYDALTDDILLFFKHSDTVLTVAYSPDSRQLAVGGKDRCVSCYDTLSAALIHTYKRTAWTRAIAYSPDGKQVAIGGSVPEVGFFDSVSGTLSHTIYHDIGGILALAYSPDGKQVAMGGNTKKATVYDRITWVVLRQLSYDGSVSSIVYSPDSSQMAIGGEDKQVIVCSSSTGTTLHKIACSSSIRSIAYSPDGEHIAVGTSVKTMNIYLTSNWEPFCSPILFHAIILGISFLPYSKKSHRDATAYILAIAVGKFSITMRVHANTRSPVEYLLKNDDDKMVLDHLRAYKTAAFWRDEKGNTLLAASIEENRPELVAGLVGYCSKHELLHSDSNRLCIALLDYLHRRNDLQPLHEIIESNCFREYTPPVQLNKIVNVLHELTKKKFVDSVIKVLDAGEEKAMPGFVYQKDGFQTSRQGNPVYNSWFRLPFYFLSNRTCTRSQVDAFSPRTSDSPIDFRLWYNYETDLDKRADLKTLRVLLPNLGSFDSLRNLIDMQSLKPFDAVSLGTVINAHWKKWAKKRFLFQLYTYLTWFLCVTLLWDVTNKSKTGDNAAVGRQWTEYFLTVLVIAGLLYFVYLEFLQWSVLDKKAYWSDGWNTSQSIARLLTVVFIILEYSNVSRGVVAHFAAMALLCNTAGVLFFLRGFDKIAWIIHALFCIMEDMIPFLIVMLVILFMFALTFWILYDASAAVNVCDPGMDCDRRSFDNIGRAMETTFYAGIFADFDIDSMEETYSTEFAKILLAAMLTIMSLISMNALIAFMGNTFGRVLGEKTAVLTRIKALFILELYCHMGARERKQIEEENRWTYIMVPKATLGSVRGTVGTPKDQDLANATKYDLLKMRAEMAELKVELAKTKAELKADIVSEFRLELENTVQKIGAMLPKERPDL